MSVGARWLAVVLAVGVAVVLVPPSLAAQLLLLGIGGTVVGLPHGALDEEVATRRLGMGVAAFYGTYLLTIAAMAGLWFMRPELAFLAFLAASAWHFGEGDLRDLGDSGGRALPRITRGTLVVGTLFSAQPGAVAELLGPELSRVVLSGPTAACAPITLAAVHLAAMWSLPGVALRRRWVESFDAVAVMAWLSLAPPVLAFAGYFCVWHSRAHLVTLFERGFRDGFVRRALPLTLASGAGLGAAIVGLQVVAPQLAVAEFLLPVIAALATPHLLLVEAWRRTDARQLRPVGPPDRASTGAEISWQRPARPVSGV